jgi:ABC-type glycerol-3-phosphate transport system substrate-binding protein
MKKVVFALVIAAGLTACGNASNEAKSDSTAVAVDTAVATTDTTAAPAATDSVVAK